MGESVALPRVCFEYAPTAKERHSGDIIIHASGGIQVTAAGGRGVHVSESGDAQAAGAGDGSEAQGLAAERAEVVPSHREQGPGGVCVPIVGAQGQRVQILGVEPRKSRNTRNRKTEARHPTASRNGCDTPLPETFTTTTPCTFRVFRVFRGCIPACVVGETATDERDAHTLALTPHHPRWSPPPLRPPASRTRTS